MRTASVNSIIACLERTPEILESLLDQIPRERYRVRRIEHKWSIHEQVGHLVEAQRVLMGRFRQFETEVNPLIKSYMPPQDRDRDHYLKMDMDAAIEKFFNLRSEMVGTLSGFDHDYWSLKGRHEIYEPYSTRLLLNHSLNVDYAHLFSIEQLGLTKPGFENEIMTLP